MRPFVTIAGGLAAATLTAITVATTVEAQPLPDPMAALREAPPYDPLHPEGAAPMAELPAAVPDPMAVAGQPQLTTATQTAEHGIPNPELGNLPNGSGAEETYYQCVACHSTAIIRQQRVTDARWEYLWEWMVEAQGMVEPDEETKSVILVYLKQNFSSER